MLSIPAGQGRSAGDPGQSSRATDTLVFGVEIIEAIKQI